MKLFNCIAFLTTVSAILIALAIGYRDNHEVFGFMAFLSTTTICANILLVIIAAVRRPDAVPAYDPED